MAPDILTTLYSAFVGAVVGAAVALMSDRLSRRTWTSQQVWKLRASLYERLITALYALEELLQPDHSHGPPPVYPELNQRGQAVASKTLRDLESATGLASLWLPPDVTKALQYVQAVDSNADQSIRSEDVYKAVSSVIKTLLVAVKRDLTL